jgi:O-antigen ligase
MTYGLLTSRRRVIAWVLGACLLISGGLVALSQFGYQRSTVDPWTFNARLAVWKLEVREVLTHPLVGIGYGGNTFMMRFAEYPEAKNANGPHSAFLMVAMGSGLPALALLLWTLFRAVRLLIQSAKKVSDRLGYAIMLAGALMIVGFATRNIFDYMFAGSLAYLFWMLLAMVLSERHMLISLDGEVRPGDTQLRAVQGGVER